jgi:hypothetical protein
MPAGAGKSVRASLGLAGESPAPPRTPSPGDVQTPRPSFARIWSFYILSGSGGADELFFREVEFEFLDQFGVFDDLFT